jgi:hypothetical protein
MTKDIITSQPSKCLLTPEDAVELLRIKLSWLYQHSCSAHIRYLDREPKQAKSPEELLRSH